jgi:hypothetical protein
LSLADNTGQVKAGLLVSAEGGITEDPAPSQLTTARLYHILNLGEYHPRALLIQGVPANSLWAWTAAAAVSASQSVVVSELSPAEIPRPSAGDSEDPDAETPAPVVTTRRETVLDIAVTFPAGETHYIIIRGIRAFNKIQLYNMDYRTDPQFERYDSSGWSYSAQEQTLVLKMKHRATVEHIRIFY